MKARLITIGESEIRQRVEEEYQKKKDQIYESVIQDVLPQFMSVWTWSGLPGSWKIFQRLPSIARSLPNNKENP